MCMFWENYYCYSSIIITHQFPLFMCTKTPASFVTLSFLTDEDPGLGWNVWIKWLRHWISRPPSLYSCTAYSGTACSHVFGAANITNDSGSYTDITSKDSAIAAIRNTAYSEACQNYVRITQCLTYVPCPGIAWCGSMSPDDLTAALRTACGYGDTRCSHSQIITTTGTPQLGQLAVQCWPAKMWILVSDAGMYWLTV